jgi:hypothetical protein
MILVYSITKEENKTINEDVCLSIKHLVERSRIRRGELIKRERERQTCLSRNDRFCFLRNFGLSI